MGGETSSDQNDLAGKIGNILGGKFAASHCGKVERAYKEAAGCSLQSACEECSSYHGR